MFTTMHWMRRKLEAFQSKQRTSATDEHLHTEYIPTEAERQAFQRIVTLLTRYAFFGFVVSFVLFLVIYAVCTLYFSGYYEWDPDPVLNPDEDDKSSKRCEEKREGGGSAGGQLHKGLEEALWNITQKLYRSRS